MSVLANHLLFNVDLSHDIDSSFHNEVVSTKRAGFYSPSDPPKASLLFADSQPWSSKDETRQDDDSNAYDGDEFTNSEDSTISDTSSVSIPQVSQMSERSWSQISNTVDTERPAAPFRVTSNRSTSRSISRLSSKLSKISTSRESRSTSGLSEDSLNQRRGTSRNSASDTSFDAGAQNDNGPTKSSYSPVKSKFIKKNPLDKKLIKTSVPSLGSSKSETNVASSESQF